jgi:hypothetical protein
MICSSVNRFLFPFVRLDSNAAPRKPSVASHTVRVIDGKKALPKIGQLFFGVQRVG